MDTPTAESKYEIGEVLGTGGFAEVVRARDPKMNRDVALKFIQASFAEDPELRDRFLAEAQVTGQLDHPNIPPVHELGVDEAGRPYFSMKLVRGENLRAVIDRLITGDAATHRRYTFYHRLQIIAQLLDALAYAHSQQILHLDIKPENIMIGPFGEVFLMDWGLLQKGMGLEHTGDAVAGTLGYAPPEQLAGGGKEGLDGRADLYALGATMYELMALKSAHPREDAGAALMHTLNGTVTPADQSRHPTQARVSREIALILEKVLERDPARRYAAAADMSAAIQAIPDGSAPIVCVQTGLKRSMQRLERLLDNHGKLVIILVTGWTVFPLITVGLLLYLLH